MRLVLDTNVLFAAYVSRGTCAVLYEQALATETLITSESILDEFYGTLRSKARVPDDEAVAARRQIAQDSMLVIPEPLTERVSRDPDDDIILATAVAGAADFLVTGDKDLLVLRSYRGIAIITPSECLARLRA